MILIKTFDKTAHGGNRVLDPCLCGGLEPGTGPKTHQRGSRSNDFLSCFNAVEHRHSEVHQDYVGARARQPEPQPVRRPRLRLQPSCRFGCPQASEYPNEKGPDRPQVRLLLVTGIIHGLLRPSRIPLPEMAPGLSERLELQFQLISRGRRQRSRHQRHVYCRRG